MAVDTPAKIAVLGAGPIGLEAALYARYLGYEVVIYERGRVGENLLRFGHVRLFSPWRLNRSPLGVMALAAQDSSRTFPPDESFPTAAEYVEQYLQPLAASDLLRGGVRENVEVLSVGRQSLLLGDCVGGDARIYDEFRILLRRAEAAGSSVGSAAAEDEWIDTADVVIDATGTFANPGWTGRGGIPAPGERALRARIHYGLPDVQGVDRARFAGKHTAVVGAGYSAATNVVALAELAEAVPKTRVTWIARRPHGQPAIDRIAEDRLPARDALAVAANQLAAAGPQGEPLRYLGSRMIESIGLDEPTGRFRIVVAGIRLPEIPSDEQADAESDGDEDAGGAGAQRQNASGDVNDPENVPDVSSEPEMTEIEVDEIISNVGYRPDPSLYTELQVHRCYASDGPMKLATALMGSEAGADCLDQQGFGPQSLLTPEPDFYILGAKSYGRNSRFLISIGLQQIRDLFTIIGDRPNLDLYASMVSARR